MKPLGQCRLYAFVDTAYLRGRKPEEVAAELCAGGADVIQLRAKAEAPAEVEAMARAVAPLAAAAEVHFVLNDYPQLARRAGVHYCHLGQEDFFQAGFRTVAQLAGCPPDLRIGLSTHAPEQARRAIAAEPAYIAIGPVYATATKPTASPVTLDYVRWAAANVKLPWFAIGGITLDNLDDVLAAGARRVAVVSAILNAPDAAEACQAFQKRLSSAPAIKH